MNTKNTKVESLGDYSGTRGGRPPPTTARARVLSPNSCSSSGSGSWRTTAAAYPASLARSAAGLASTTRDSELDGDLESAEWRVRMEKGARGVWSGTVLDLPVLPSCCCRRRASVLVLLFLVSYSPFWCTALKLAVASTCLF